MTSCNSYYAIVNLGGLEPNNNPSILYSILHFVVKVLIFLWTSYILLPSKLKCFFSVLNGETFIRQVLLLSYLSNWTDVRLSPFR